MVISSFCNCFRKSCVHDIAYSYVSLLCHCSHMHNVCEIHQFFKVMNVITIIEAGATCTKIIIKLASGVAGKIMPQLYDMVHVCSHPHNDIYLYSAFTPFS